MISVPLLSRFFENFADSDLNSLFGNASFSPAINVAETETGYRLELAAPGFKKDNFSIKLENHVLTIKGELKEEKEEKNEKFTRREFKASSFERSFSIPEDIHEDGIEAKYEDGVLTVQLKKAEQPKRVKKIQVV
jgi:HSP20 family protein